MQVHDVVTFVWQPEQKVIAYETHKRFTPERMRFWLYHTFLPLLVQTEGWYDVLHTASVKIGENAVLFSAPSRGGKSTLTDFFLRRGHPLVSDDTVAIASDDTLRVVPSHPFYRPYRTFETLGERAPSYCETSLPLSTLYRLVPLDPAASPYVKTIRGFEKLRIVQQSEFISIAFLRLAHFAFQTAFSQKVRCAELGIPWDKKRLFEVYEAILRYESAVDR
jgi:hypothetical protein